MKSIEDMTKKELIENFENRLCDYDSRRDDEVNFLCDNPNRDMWDEEMIDEYKNIIDDIRKDREWLKNNLKYIKETI